MIVEIKKHLGVLEVETQALAELLLQAFYLLNGYSAYMVGKSLLCCLADFHHFHYFRLDVPTTFMSMVQLFMCDIVCDAGCGTVKLIRHYY